MDITTQVKNRLITVLPHKLSIRTFNYFFFIIVILFTVFDGVRNYSVFSGYVSQLKELSILILFLSLLAERGFKLGGYILGKVGVSNILYFLIVSPVLVFFYLKLDVIGIRITEYYYFPIILHYKTLQFFLIICVFSYFESLTGRRYDELIKFFIAASLVYVLFSYAAYFYHFPFMRVFRPYVGRISNGYPTMDGQVLCFAYLANLFVAPFRRKKFWVQLLISFILIVGIISQATGTGLVTLFCVTVFYLFCYARKYTLPNKRNNLKILVLSFGVLSLCGLYVVFNYYFLFEAMINMIERKFLAVINLGQNTSVDYSVQLRENQFNNMMNVKNDLFHLLFGAGTFLGYQIENQYGFLLRSYGVIGLGLFSLYIFRNMFYAWWRNFNFKLLMIGATGVFALTSYSLISTYLFSTSAAYGLMFGYVYSKNFLRKYDKYRLQVME